MKIMLHKMKFIILFFIFLLVHKIEKKNDSRNIALYKAKKYMTDCLKGILINNNFKNNFYNYINLKITIIVPVFNCLRFTIVDLLLEKLL